MTKLRKTEGSEPNKLNGVKIRVENFKCDHCEFVLLRKNAIKAHMTVNHEDKKRDKP